MPQLNPHPWFLILMMSWLIYLMVMSKSNSLKMLNNSLTKTNQYFLKSWNWPWI
uniref:ATP synthase complex subunit 8 n=1 Tax=Bolitoglossa n. sp. RLM-2004 TaxID=291262 RepID=Q644A9_9SALA|nr:ATP synthase F0 subunit 8 [Bolitoglossa n. sp. RLM-2004]AAU20725.1 ATP synthase F0 subunit 8 [Bolitoglossa n. sp. RLM-2004]